MSPRRAHREPAKAHDSRRATGVRETRPARPTLAYAAATRLAWSMPITFRRRCSALKANVFVSCIV
jgi:hypothetical protein